VSKDFSMSQQYYMTEYIYTPLFLHV